MALPLNKLSENGQLLFVSEHYSIRFYEFF